MTDDLTMFFIYAAEGTVAGLVARWLLRGIRNSQRHAGQRVGQTTVISYGWAFRTFALFGFIGMIAFFFAARAGGGSERVQALFLCFVLLAASCCLEAFFTRVVCHAGHLERRSIWRRRAELRWQDIDSVNWSEGLQWFGLCSASGETAYVHGLMNGVGAMAQKVIELAPHACDAEALAHFERLVDDTAAKQKLRGTV